MARKAEATLWIKLKIGGRSVMKRMTKNGRSYAHKVEGRCESGSFYLRYTRNGKRMWESVGNDITLALQEQRARQSALETPQASRTADVPVHRMLREVAGEFRKMGAISGDANLMTSKQVSFEDCLKS